MRAISSKNIFVFFVPLTFSANQQSDGSSSTKQLDNILLATTSKNIPHTSTSSPSSSSSSSSTSSQSTSSAAASGKHIKSAAGCSAEPIIYLDEEKIDQLLDECKTSDSHAPLIRIIGQCFSSRDSVVRSFQKRPSASIDALLEKAPKDLKNLKKEDFRTLEGDLDKDEDSSADIEQKREPHHTTVDLVSLRRTMYKLYNSNVRVFESLNNALHSLAINLSLDSRFKTQKDEIEEIITAFVIVFEIVWIGKCADRYVFRCGTTVLVCKRKFYLQSKVRRNCWTLHFRRLCRRSQSCRHGLRHDCHGSGRFTVRMV